MRAAGAVAAALAVSGLPAPAQAQQAPSPLLAGLVTEQGPARQYATTDGTVRFVFDRRSRERVALLRFDGDPEVHVLRPQAAPGGDEMYRTESGDVALRVTPHGGLTVYTRGHSAGVAAAEVRDVEPLTPRGFEVAAYQARMRALQAAASQRLGRPLTFVVPRTPSADAAGVLVDAAERVAQGVSVLRNTPIERIVIQVGPRPGSAVRGADLVVQVAPEMGYAGRPSSVAIRNVVQRASQGPEQ